MKKIENDTKNILFVLPRYLREPVGGYKVVFEYANRLCKMGYNLSLLFLNRETAVNYQMPEIARYILNEVLTRIEPSWFDLDKRVTKFSATRRSAAAKIATPDIVVATAVETIDYVMENYSHVNNKLYLIQDYEIWNTNAKLVNKSFAYDIKKVVISNWLKELVDIYSDTPAVVVSNPIDLTVYRCLVPQKDRRRHTVSLLYHDGEYKGIKYALQALEILKNEYSDLHVEMFGKGKRPTNLPGWINYTKNATTDQTVHIYNSTQVFLCATINEGFGLTGMEAMACGTVLVSTDYGGVHEYAIKERNSLLSEIKNPHEMADNVKRVFEDEELRLLLSVNGINDLKDHSWEKATEKLCEIMGIKYIDG